MGFPGSQQIRTIKMEKYNSPILARWLIILLSRFEKMDSMVFEMEDEFMEILEYEGKRAANKWYWNQTIKSLPRFFKFSIYWGGIMFKNYAKMAFRNILKQPVHSLINIFGLAVAMVVFILILLFVQNEYSYDHFHEKHNRIYRVSSIWGENEAPFSGTPMPLASFFEDNFPEVENTVRISSRNGTLKFGDKTFFEKRIFLADPSIYEVFDFELISGDKEKVLEGKNSIVFSESMAIKYFGYKNPIGKIVSLNEEEEFLVTGIIEDVPSNSHIHFDFLIPFNRIDDLTNWRQWNFYTYLLMKENTSITSFKENTLSWAKGKTEDELEMMKNFSYQPLTNIHFEYDRNNLEPSFDKTYTDIFITVAIIVLIIACINFMNLSTAKSTHRAKEVGLRKVSGAFRNQIIFQFLGESIFLAFISHLAALLIVGLFIPVFNDITAKELSLNLLDPGFIAGIIGLVFITGILAGIYPAFILSSFKPVKVLKGKMTMKNFSLMRNMLVVFQFTASVILVISTLIINEQLSFIQNKNLGLNKELVINIPLKSKTLREKSEFVRSEFSSLPWVINASINSFSPGDDAWHHSAYWDGQTENDLQSMFIYYVDENFVSTLEIEMLSGEKFLNNFTYGEENLYLVNETAMNEMGWEFEEGRNFSAMGKQNLGKIIGVFKDFHYRSLHHDIAPLALLMRKNGNQLSLKVRSENIAETIASLKNKWAQIEKGLVFDYKFMDDDFARLYEAEETSRQIAGLFTIFSIFIACLGLFGLATYAAEQRTKEIGIRKSLGASVASILNLLSKETITLVVISNIIAWPLTYYLMKKWLTNFSFQIGINPIPFLLSAVIVFILAIISVGYSALKAALSNPVEAIKYE